MGCLTDFNSEFSFSKTGCCTKVKARNLSYYSPCGRIVEFIPFSRVLTLCEMQTDSSMIWTRVAVPISSDRNLYTFTSFRTLSSYFSSLSLYIYSERERGGLSTFLLLVFLHVHMSMLRCDDYFERLINHTSSQISLHIPATLCLVKLISSGNSSSHILCSLKTILI